MKNIYKYAFITGVAIGAAAAVILIISGSRKEKEEKMEAAETVELFCRSVASGDWEDAAQVCDTLLMQDYIDRCRNIWETETDREEKRIVELAKEMMSSMTFTALQEKKVPGGVEVSFCIEMEGEEARYRTATLKRQEGIWKVTEITDSIQEEKEKI